MGVDLHNENKLDEMSKIMDHYMKYVPTIETKINLDLPNGDSMVLDDTRFSSILFGGDQVTAVRMRSTQALRDSHDNAIDRLEGLLPIVEDWHTRLTLMKVHCYFAQAMLSARVLCSALAH